MTAEARTCPPDLILLEQARDGKIAYNHGQTGEWNEAVYLLQWWT
jgi:hypothetical protein